MGKPSIRVDGSLSGIGVADEDRSSFLPGETLTFTDVNIANAGADYTGAWSILSMPEGATATLVNANTPSPTLVLDSAPYRPGSYIILCSVGGQAGYAMPCVLLNNSGGRVPAFGEEIGVYTFRPAGGNSRNYVPAVNETLISLDALVGAGSSAPATSLATLGAPVVVDTAAAPTPGQVLTSVSPTQAAWITPAVVEDIEWDNEQSTLLDESLNQYWFLNYTDIDAGLLGMSNLTIECWIKPSHVNDENRTILGAGGTQGPFGWKFALRADGGIYLAVQASTGLTQVSKIPSPLLVADEWVHVAATWNGTTGLVTIYVDGVVIGTETGDTGTINDPGDNWRVGDNSDSTVHDEFGGNISELRVWSTERTGAEINEYMEGSLSGTESGLAGYWPFDGDGSDQTGNGSDLTPVNGATFDNDIPVGIAAGPVTDDDAVHVDVDGEIVAIAEKLVPVAGDALIIEDSQDSDSKKMIRISNLPASGGGGALELISSVVIGTAVSSYNFTGLDGDADGHYILRYTILTPADTSSRSWTVRPNGLPNSSDFDSDNGLNRWRLANIGGAASFHISGEIRISAATGVYRFFEALQKGHHATYGYSSEQLSGVWKDSTTNITSLEIESNNLGLEVGTKLDLYKLKVS